MDNGTVELLWDTVELRLIMISRPLQSASVGRSSGILAGKLFAQHDLDFGALRSAGIINSRDFLSTPHSRITQRNSGEKSGSVPQQ